MNVIEDVFGVRIPVIGVVHLKALPGAPLYQDESVADIALCRLAARRRACDFSFFHLTFPGVGEEVVGITGTHDTATCQC